MWRLITLLVFMSCSTVKADKLVEQFYAFSGNDGDSEIFVIDLPEQVLNLIVESSGDIGDVDIFLSRQDQEEYLDFTYCANRRQDSNEICRLGMPSAGRYLVRVKAFQPGSNANLRIAYLVHEHQSTSSNKVKLPVLLNLERNHEIEFKQSILLKTHTRPNSERLSFVLANNNQEVFMRVYSGNIPSSGGELVCESLVSKNVSGQCAVLWPDGIYYVELIASKQSQSLTAARLTLKTDVDSIDADSVWRDPEVKAFKWDVAKVIPPQAEGKTYYYEITPRIDNLENNLDQIVNHRMNGFLMNSLQGEVSMGHDWLVDLSEDNCVEIPGVEVVKCNYDLDTVESTQVLRIKVQLPSTSQDIHLIHKDTTFYGKPSPSCPSKKGCDGDPDA